MSSPYRIAVSPTRAMAPPATAVALILTTPLIATAFMFATGLIDSIVGQWILLSVHGLVIMGMVLLCGHYR